MFFFVVLGGCKIDFVCRVGTLLLTYPLCRGTFEDDFPVLQVVGVNCLQGIDSAGSILDQANNFEPQPALDSI